MQVDEDDMIDGPDGPLQEARSFMLWMMAARFLCDQVQVQDRHLEWFPPRHDPFYHARYFYADVGAPDTTLPAQLDGHFPQTTGAARLCLHGRQAECGT